MKTWNSDKYTGKLVMVRNIVKCPLPWCDRSEAWWLHIQLLGFRNLIAFSSFRTFPSVFFLLFLLYFPHQKYQKVRSEDKLYLLYELLSLVLLREYMYNSSTKLKTVWGTTKSFPMSFSFHITDFHGWKSMATVHSSSEAEKSIYTFHLWIVLFSFGCPSI